ncbi:MULTISPECIES: hypothetical protein [Methylobacterium]|uniref:hypothetical protein n=1 Tax=Methylobacterium TaxID=407 RepID=UPI001043F957|nr:MULTISPECIES: hypothetical protein [Methylobacterium]MDR7035998.1 hypothetical protein [Methylobacterium sp. BE186]
MKLQNGLLYRTRSGRTAGPVRRRGDRVHPWEGLVEGMDALLSWTDDGHFYADGKSHGLDLVGHLRGSADKAIDQMTLEDYRRGIARLYGPVRSGE